MKMKILSPAGDMESLYQAVFNGADEVYLGVKDFNARNIQGFSLETLKEAVNFSHIFGVKVHLTVNILFNDDEIQDALNLICDAYNLGVDAFIIQDVGLASLVHKFYPSVEMHASTQMAIHNLKGVKFAESLGFKRVVLARETPLSEIKRIKENSNVEIEYFVQGALCVCFSGNCYLSSYLNNASGNRGKCKQLCRLPYTLMFENRKLKEGYLLSAKDFNMLDRLEDLKNAGVDAIKIEGRARRPYYVAEATKTYRNAIDEIDYKNNLELAFNRGFTEGYFNGNGNIISKYQAHMGIEIGKVVDVKFGKKFNEIIISSSKNFSPKSTLKFFKNNKEIAVLTAYDLKKKNNCYIISTTQKIEKGASVNLISDYEIEQKTLSTKLKRNVQIFISAKENEAIKAEFEINNQKFLVTGEICEPAKNAPLTKENFIDCFSKNDIFNANLNINLGNVFLTKQKLNEFRRTVFEKIYNLLTEVKKEKLNYVQIQFKPNNLKFKNFQFVENLTENFEKENIIYSPSNYELENVLKFLKLCKSKCKKAYLNLPNFALKDDIEFLKQIINSTKIPIVVNNFWAINFENEKVLGGYMNIFNSFSANLFNLPYISAEGEDFYPMAVMTLRHCPMKNHLNADCANCPYKDGFSYKMENGKILKLKRLKMSSCSFYLIE